MGTRSILDGANLRRPLSTGDYRTDIRSLSERRSDGPRIISVLITQTKTWDTSRRPIPNNLKSRTRSSPYFFAQFKPSPVSSIMQKTPKPPVESVQLSSKDWVGLLALSMTIISAFFMAYQRHDRLLSEIAVSQQLQGERINRLENKLDALERDLRGR